MKNRLPKLMTRAGHSEHGDNYFRGCSVAKDLVGQESYTSMLALSITGRRLTKKETELLDDLVVASAIGDPRIWPLKLSQITASHGSSIAGVASGLLCLDHAPIGHFSTNLAAEFLVSFRETVSDDASDKTIEEECKRLLASGRKLPGIGVPFRNKDERVTIFSSCIVARGRDSLPHWKLLSRMTESLRKLKGLEPNIGIVGGATCLDMGFTPAELGLLLVSLGQTDFWANAVESASRPPNVLRTLPTGCTKYVGKEPRMSPRAEEERTTSKRNVLQNAGDQYARLLDLVEQMKREGIIIDEDD